MKTEPMKSEGTRDQNVGAFAALIDSMGDDEIRVLLVLARRLKAGQDCYGKLDLENDKRDFRKERGEEVADLLVYSAFLELNAITKPSLACTGHVTHDEFTACPAHDRSTKNGA